MYPKTRLAVPSGFFSHPSNTGTTLAPELWRTCPSWGGSCALDRIASSSTRAAPSAHVVRACRVINMVITRGHGSGDARASPRHPAMSGSLLLLGGPAVVRLPRLDLRL